MTESVHEIKEKNGILYPNKLKGWYFPNHFNKFDFELFLDRKITDEEFYLMKLWLGRGTTLHRMVRKLTKVCLKLWEDVDSMNVKMSTDSDEAEITYESH